MDYKEAIEKRVQLAGGHFFEMPPTGIREYPLKIPGHTGLADFCWHFGTSGRLFIEDEDNSSQRALNNLVKYWLWCDENPNFGPIGLIHIVGSENRLNVKNAYFLGKKMEEALNSRPFFYHVVPNVISGEWHNPKAAWLTELEQTVKKILDLMARD